MSNENMTEKKWEHYFEHYNECTLKLEECDYCTKVSGHKDFKVRMLDYYDKKSKVTTAEATRRSYYSM